jgi:putative tricarboxylic transport membrane protein
MFAETFNFPEKFNWQAYGPAFYPRIILSIIGFFTVLLLIRSFISNKRVTEGNEEKRSFWKEYGTVIWLFVSFGIYVLLLSLMVFFYQLYFKYFLLRQYLWC